MYWVDTFCNYRFRFFCGLEILQEAFVKHSVFHAMHVRDPHVTKKGQNCTPTPDLVAFIIYFFVFPS